MTPGTRLGSYEIVAAIGRGGMGEVYRARDSRLQRDVAIKVVPPLFARDPERLARFDREARTLAALNHPHVAQVYGVVDLPPEAGGHALVMEFVDGEDLAQRLQRTGAIPLDEALPIAAQIAEAIEAAHEIGIIHRDLKPANVKLRADGEVKVLDFGLAKALAPAESSAPAVLDNSPTITSPFQLSQLGVVLGTAAYMAPEQAKGKPVDKRADIWAFGCVLFEMLTGRRPFDGEDVTETLAAIVRSDPDWSRLPAETPPAVRTLLRRCLEKDRRERLPDIGAARLELKDVIRADGRPASAAPPPPARRLPAVPWVIAAIATLAALAGAAMLTTRRGAAPPADTRVYKSAILLPSALNAAPALRLQLSHDGRRIAFVGQDQTRRNVLWVRPLDGLTAQAIAGTNDASAPFWSPDDRWIAFFAEGKLKKVDLSSGAIVTICDAVATPPGSWNRQDVIIFNGSMGIARVPASGGTPVLVTDLQPGEQTHIAPFFLPDGHHFLFTVSIAGSRQPGIFVGTLDSKERLKLSDTASNAAYANGYLLYLRETTLMAQPFDAGSLKLSGSALPLAEGLQMNPSSGTGAFSVSDTGVLAYQAGSSAGTQLTWFDRAGEIAGTLGEPRGFRDVQLSPDNRTVLATIAVAGFQGDVWLFDVSSGLQRRFTFDQLTAGAIWSPDGRFVVYGARRGAGTAPRDLYRRSATGSGAEELLLHDDRDKIPLSLSNDGQALVYRTASGTASGDLWLLPLGGERKPRPFNPGDRTCSAAAISPDGRWIAYSSSATGRRDIFVTSFPDGNGRWQVSSEGGDNPVWRADGQELFYTANDRIVAVPVKASGERFDSGGEQALFSAHVPATALGTRSTFAVTRDGQKFLVNTWDASAATAPLTLVVNWPAALQK